MKSFCFSLSRRQCFWLLLAVACLTILPFLGLTDFHTKGEPREAVVAYSMLDSGNWILPRNNGGEIPYKPPFFHWCIAAASLLTGHVTEFTSRLPSALAIIAMTMMVFAFYARRKGTNVALLTAFISLTAFELHRAGANCRVDMMLTALTVGALLLFYRYWQRGLRGIPLLAILLMSCATLTKGPVGTLIPCLVFGIFLLLRGVNFFKAFGLLLAWGALSLVLPLCWYWAAWMQGGQEFLDLVLEENFGRMTSTMSYDSCVNPWYYNFITLAGGYVPWILLVLIALFAGRFHFAALKQCGEGFSIKSIFSRLRTADPVNLFSALSVVVIFLFYCFPQSKRSVYLMPIYPFIAYFLACFVVRLANSRSVVLKIYGSVLAVVSLLLSAAFVAVRCGAVPEALFAGRHGAQNLAMMQQLMHMPWYGWVLAAVAAALGVGWWFWMSRNRMVSMRYPYAICVLTFGLYAALDGAYLPRILQAKSQRPVAAQIDAIAPASSGTIYEYIEAGEMALGDPLHFFEINFYLGNRIANFLKCRPDEGYLLIPVGDDERHFPEFEAQGYAFTLVYTSPAYRPVRLYRFTNHHPAE